MDRSEKTPRKYLIPALIAGAIVALGSLIVVRVLVESIIQDPGKRRELRVIPGEDVVLTFSDEPDSPRMKFIWIDGLDMWFGETEVTIEQYDRFYGRINIRYYFGLLSYVGSFSEWPAYEPTWPAMLVVDLDAEMFGEWLTKRYKLPEGYMFRIPTHTEWNFVASNGGQADYLYPWGSAWPPEPMFDGVYPNLWGVDPMPAGGSASPFYADWSRRKYVHPEYKDGHAGPAPVFQSGKNPLGIYGLAGNVEEWCYGPAPSGFVLKGGMFTDTDASYLRVIHNGNYSYLPDAFTSQISRGDYGTGCRIVLGRQRFSGVRSPNAP